VDGSGKMAPPSRKLFSSPNGRRRASEYHGQVERMRNVYGVDLVAGLTGRGQSARAGTLRFLTWLADGNADDIGCKVVAAFWGGADSVFGTTSGSGEDGAVSDVSHERAFFDVFARWCREWAANPEGLSQETIGRQCRACGAHLEQMAGQHPGIPAAFKASMRFPRPTNQTPTPSLGEARWPELGALTGVERERAALRYVRSECCKAFLEEEEAFRHGRAVLCGKIPAGMDPVSCSRARAYFVALEEVLRSTGSFGEETLRPFTAAYKINADLLRAAGFRFEDNKALTRNAFRFPFMPTSRMTSAVIGVLVCDTGWNLQPILDLPKEPFLFRSPDRAYLAAPAFIEAFKKRAGHHVLAYLGETEEISGARLEVAKQLWSTTIERDGNPRSPRHAVLPTFEQEALSAIDILERYQTVADTLRETVRDLPVAVDLNRRFLIDLPFHGAGLDRVRIPLRGANYKAIRKTVQLIRLEESGSIQAVARSAGHAGDTVIMPHYLNAPHVNARLDESIRAFQDAMQGLMTRELDQRLVAGILGLSEVSLAGMRRHAERAGIAAVLGLVPISEGPNGRFVLRFAPEDPEALANLFLVHRALRDLGRRTANYARFRLRFLPMLAIVKAIGRDVFRSGQGRSYRAAARNVVGRLKAGTASLPFLGE
jgi:hypothetical protein